ncbi:MAG: hypothetical protein DSZ11_02855, partial [Sulfurovum sp.]
MSFTKTLSLMSILFLTTACVQIKEPKKGSKNPTQAGVIVLPPYQGGVTVQQPPYQGGVIIQQPPYQGGVTVQQPPYQGGVIVQQPPIPQGPPIPVAPVPNLFSMQSLSSPYLYGAYSHNYKLKNFINKMVNEHNFRRDYLNAVFSSVQRDTEALKKIGAFNTAKPSGSQKLTPIGSWDKYRSNFLTSSR